MMNTRRQIRRLLACVPLALALGSCDSGVVYDSYGHVGSYGWDKGDTLFFDIPPVKAAGSYSFSVGLRTNSNFPFMSLSLVVERLVNPGGKVYVDTLKCRLADEKGHVSGHGISCYQYDFDIPAVGLHRGDSVRVGVRHIMRRETLPGISDIGLKVTSANRP